MNARLWLVGLVLGTSTQALCQKRNHNLIFGDNLWLDFNGDSLEVRGSPYSPTNRSATMSDTSGVFLFLVDETGIRDTTFTLMPGGSAAQLGWPERLSAVMILPKPGDPQRYVVLVNTPESLRQAGWVEVDMGLNGGLGGVVTGTTWYMNECTSKLAATTHANGTDYWVVQHENGSDAFHAFLLSANGLALPIVSSMGPVFDNVDSSAPLNTDFWGPMLFSPIGDVLCLASYVASDTNGIMVAPFDQSTGSIGLGTEIAAIAKYVVNMNGPIQTDPRIGNMVSGVEFLATGSRAYAAQIMPDSPLDAGGYASFQVDPYLTPADSMAANAINTFSLTNSALHPWLRDTTGRSIMLGPDGSLYMRSMYNTGGALLRPTNLPATWSYNNDHYFYWVSGFSRTTGFPLFSKRYHDSEPAWLAVSDLSIETGTWLVSPNPLAGRGWVKVPPGGPDPEQVVWLDLLGKPVRTVPVKTNGSTFPLDAGQLPIGHYTVRFLVGSRPVGQARVVVAH